MQAKSYFLAIGSILFWTTLATIITQLRHLPSFFLLGAGLLVGGLIGLLFLNKEKPSIKKIAAAVFGIFGFHLFLFIAFKIAPPVEANLINYLWPLLLVVFTPLFFRNMRLHWNHLIGILMGFGGALLVVSGGQFQLTGTYLLGYFLALISGITWAIFTLISKKLAPFESINIAYGCFISSILAFAYHFLFEPSFIPGMKEVGFILYLGAGPMGAAFYFWNGALKHGDPRIIGSLAYLTPLFSTLLLTTVTSGRLTIYTGFAMVLIIGGAWVSSLQSGSKKKQTC